MMKIVPDESTEHALSGVNGEIALAYKRNTFIKDPLDFLNDISELDFTEATIYEMMEVADKLSKMDGLCAQTIDVMVSFAASEAEFEATGNKTLDRILTYFSEFVNYGTGIDVGMNHLIKRMVRSYLVHGNTFPLKIYKKIELSDLSFVMPVRTVLLSPWNIYIDPASAPFGPKGLLFRVDDDLAKEIKKDGRTSDITQSVPNLIRKKYRLLNKTKNNVKNHIKLDNRLASHLKRSALDFESWGIPYLAKSFRAVSVVNRLQRLDEATLEGLINLITIFKIGTDEYPATPSRLKAFANLFTSGNGVDPNKYLVWSHDVDILQVGPDNKILGFEKRHTDAQAYLKNALGLPGALRGEHSTGDPWPTFLGMLETLIEVRKVITTFLQEVALQIADQNNIMVESIPTIKWRRMNLDNDVQVKNLILTFYDRGLLDAQTAIEESGRSYEVILARKKEQKEQGLDELFKHPKLPYSSDPSSDEGKAPEGDVKKKEKTSDKADALELDLFEKADKEIFESIFAQLVDDINTKEPQSHELFVVARYQQLLEHVFKCNDILKLYGSASQFRHVVDKSKENILANLTGSNRQSLIDLIRKERINIWNDVTHLRKDL